MIIIEKMLIIAGVGAGKTTLIKQLGIDNTLLITSRKATVEDSLFSSSEPGTSSSVLFPYVGEEILSWGYETRNSFNNIKYVTHASALKAMKSTNPRLLVVDEAHALFVDSTFIKGQEEILDEMLAQQDMNIIFMTATPHPLLDWCVANNFKIVDLRDKRDVPNVLPKEIIITTKEQFFAPQHISSFSGYYFGTSKKSILEKQSILQQFDKNTELVVSDTVHSKVDFTKSTVNTDDTVILSTSVLREGINLEANQAATESLNMLDNYQFAGRFRNGLDKLYIITDEKQLLPARRYMYDAIKTTDLTVLPSGSKEIADIEKYSNDYLYYSKKYDKWNINHRKYNAETYQINRIENWKNEIQLFFGKDIKVTYHTHKAEKSTVEVDDDKQRKMLLNVIESMAVKRNGRRTLTVEDLDVVLKESKKLLVYEPKSCCFYTSGTKLMKDLGYVLKRTSRNKKSAGYDIYYVYEAVLFEEIQKRLKVGDGCLLQEDLDYLLKKAKEIGYTREEGKEYKTASGLIKTFGYKIERLSNNKSREKYNKYKVNNI